MDLILPLAAASKLPTPVAKPSVAHEDSASEEHAVQQEEEAGPPSPRLAAYQALPVTQTTLITHNITPALPVPEDGELDKEVRLQQRCQA